MPPPARRLAGLLTAALAACGGPAAARTLDVGPGRTYASPSEAAAVAADGDTVAITPGSYFDCAIWAASGLIIAGTGPDVRITDKACAGKAAFVIQGNGVTVRGISFMRIRVPDGNGAGIRAEGRDLAVEDSRFVNNQIAILAGGEGVLRISDCVFSANGAGTADHPLSAVMVGPLERLLVSHSVFEEGRSGGYITSSALRTDLIDSRLTDEGSRMTGPLVTLSGNTVILDRNTIDLAAGAADRLGAVLVVGDAEAVTVRGNTLIEPHGSVPLVRNWGGVEATEDGNNVPLAVDAVSQSEATYHRLRSRVASLSIQARAAAGAARQQAAKIARALGLAP